MKIVIRQTETPTKLRGVINPLDANALRRRAKLGTANRVDVLDFLQDAEVEIRRLYSEILEGRA